jgi:hypothetical protein
MRDMARIQQDQYAELAEAASDSAEWQALVASDPELAAEIEIARKVRLLMVVMQEAHIAVPAGFEARLMERIRTDRTLVDLIDLWLSGIGRVALELLTLFFAIVPQPTVAPSTPTA